MGFRRSLALWAWLLILAGLVAAGSGAAAEIPPPAGPITDRAGVLGQDARQRLARILDETKQRPKAEEVYRKLIAESPEAHTLHYNLGLVCFKLGRLDEAEPLALRALEIYRLSGRPASRRPSRPRSTAN